VESPGEEALRTLLGRQGYRFQSESGRDRLLLSRNGMCRMNQCERAFQEKMAFKKLIEKKSTDECKGLLAVLAERMEKAEKEELELAAHITFN